MADSEITVQEELTKIETVVEKTAEEILVDPAKDFVKQLEEKLTEAKQEVLDLNERLDVLAERWNEAAKSAATIAEEARTRVLALEARIIEFNTRNPHKI